MPSPLGRLTSASSTTSTPKRQGRLADEDEAALIAAELDRLDTELLAVGQRLERLGTALAAALNVTDREPALAGV